MHATRRGVPWWTPLLALAVLVAGVILGAVLSHRGSSTAHGVLGARHASVRARPVRRRVAPAVTTAAAVQPARTTARQAATKAPPPLRPGMRAAEHSVRVLDVVGPRIFWVGRDKAHSVLVHLQGRGTRWSIRAGQRITFLAAVARNRRGAAGAWGLTRREGRDRYDRRGVHFEVYGPRIRFLCVLRCST